MATMETITRRMRASAETGVGQVPRLSPRNRIVDDRIRSHGVDPGAPRVDPGPDPLGTDVARVLLSGAALIENHGGAEVTSGGVVERDPAERLQWHLTKGGQVVESSGPDLDVHRVRTPHDALVNMRGLVAVEILCTLREMGAFASRQPRTAIGPTGPSF